MTTNTNTRLYIANLGKYNEGELVREWIDCPFTEEELTDLYVNIGVGYYEDEDDKDTYKHGLEVNGVMYEETAIHGYKTDAPIKINEYSNVEDINAQIEALEELDEWDAKKIYAAIEYFGYTVDEALDKIDDFNLYEDINDDYTLGYYYVEDAGIYDKEALGTLVNYIDYEAFGRDIRLEAIGGMTNYGFIEEA